MIEADVLHTGKSATHTSKVSQDVTPLFINIPLVRDRHGLWTVAEHGLPVESHVCEQVVASITQYSVLVVPSVERNHTREDEQMRS